jgi:hypothetical protein
MELFGSDLSVTFGNRSAGVSRGVPFNVDYLHSSTNTVHDLYMLMRGTTGTPAAGIGVGMRFDVETSGSNYETGARIEAVTSDVSAGSEDFYLSFLTMKAGATASEDFRIQRTATALDTSLMLYDVDNAQMERVSVGAADSGGSGFKVLRIPN